MTKPTATIINEAELIGGDTVEVTATVYKAIYGMVEGKYARKGTEKIEARVLIDLQAMIGSVVRKGKKTLEEGSIRVKTLSSTPVPPVQ